MPIITATEFFVLKILLMQQQFQPMFLCLTWTILHILEKHHYYDYHKAEFAQNCYFHGFLVDGIDSVTIVVSDNEDNATIPSIPFCSAHRSNKSLGGCILTDEYAHNALAIA